MVGWETGQAVASGPCMCNQAALLRLVNDVGWLSRPGQRGESGQSVCRFRLCVVAPQRERQSGASLAGWMFV